MHQAGPKYFSLVKEFLSVPINAQIALKSVMCVCTHARTSTHTHTLAPGGAELSRQEQKVKQHTAESCDDKYRTSPHGLWNN